MGEVSTLPITKHTPRLLHIKTENGGCGSVAMVTVQHCNIDVYVWYAHCVSAVSATPLCTSLDSSTASSFVSSLKVHVASYTVYDLYCTKQPSNPYVESTTILPDTGIFNQAI